MPSKRKSNDGCHENRKLATVSYYVKLFIIKVAVKNEDIKHYVENLTVI